MVKIKKIFGVAALEFASYTKGVLLPGYKENAFICVICLLMRTYTKK